MRPNQLVAFVCLLLAVSLVVWDLGLLPTDGILPPPPPSPPDVLFAIVVEESGETSPELARILLDREVRGLFPEYGFRPIDPDTPVAPDLQPWVTRAEQEGLPRLFLVDPQETVWYTGDPPLTVEGWRTLVEGIKHGNF